MDFLKNTEKPQNAKSSFEEPGILDKLEQVISAIREASSSRSPDEPVRSLELSISGIKEAFEKYWESEYIPLARKIFNSIESGIPTPVLTVCGRGTEEIRFTRYLAYFLDPSKPHGLEDSVLKAAFGPEVQRYEFPENWSLNVEVETDAFIGTYRYPSGKTVNCFPDIMISKDGFVIIIEHKILSGESVSEETGLRQLQRYSSVLSENQDFQGKMILKIFLTPKRQLPSKATDWIPLSHQELITRISKLLTSPMPNIVNNNLRSFLFDLATGPYKKNEELFRYLKTVSAEIIRGNYQLAKIIEFSRAVDENKELLTIIEGVEK